MTLTSTQIKHLFNQHVLKPFEIVIAAMIVLSVLAFALSTLPEKSHDLWTVLRIADNLFLGIFTLEYALRIWLAEKKRDYLFSFYGIIDLICILPFYISALMGLESLRLLRLFRLLRIFKFMRYNNAITRVWRAIYASREELLVFLGASMVMILLSGVGIYHFEHKAQPEVYRSLFDALWWAVITLTTVGYGDMYPITVGGRLFTFVILMVGLGLIAVPTGIITSSLNAIKEKMEREEESKKIRRTPGRTDREP